MYWFLKASQPIYAALVFGKFGGILQLLLKTLLLNVLLLSWKNAEHITAFLENVLVCHLNSLSYSFDKEEEQGKADSHSQVKKILLVRRPEIIVKLQELQDKNPLQANKQKVNGEYTKKQQRKMSPPKTQTGKWRADTGLWWQHTNYDIFIYKYILYKITLIFSCFPVLPLFDEMINVSLHNLFTKGNFSFYISAWRCHLPFNEDSWNRLFAKYFYLFQYIALFCPPKLDFFPYK